MTSEQSLGGLTLPELNSNIDSVGTGFAAFLSPPGPEVIRFTVGQPDFATPTKVVDSAKAALDRGETAYTRTQGSPELCDAVSKHLASHSIEIEPENIVVAPGCKQAVLYAMMATLNPCLLYTSPSPRDATLSRMPSSA